MVLRDVALAPLSGEVAVSFLTSPDCVDSSDPLVFGANVATLTSEEPWGVSLSA